MCVCLVTPYGLVIISKIRQKPIIKFFNDRQRTTILKNLETAEILQEQKENFSLLQVREARDYFSKELEDVINVSECESHPWSNIQFWSSFHRKRYQLSSGVRIGPSDRRVRPTRTGYFRSSNESLVPMYSVF